jgi:hypothetical protein
MFINGTLYKRCNFKNILDKKRLLRIIRILLIIIKAKIAATNYRLVMHKKNYNFKI